ncbi:hypothetical protein Pla123a_08110 [Posidoniimonas polymericola]|uniref:Four-carbon acid sugar kinase family protein n=1 Tax=Posidoniimonas polymericola TaxID=2528002 RepID=A0A5C5ZHH2_9BACT|nr:four-carbon acid sugar kinase family protein [Posidoniimonas polymericola]TWT86003.1 hypothetical protein Pla123a_08110 [Posidoniimonas polymericola]
MTTSTQKPLRLAYYADDFTGSTDALQVLSRAGLRARLFLKPPTPEQLADLPPLDAIGVAGHSRSLPTAELEPTLRPVFESLRLLAPRHVHYKVCSTFDSSPRLGSIGRAMEIGRTAFAAPYIPIVVGSPTLGRWCAFGNLFARYGIGSQGAVYRLDRHPAMRNHPVTPASESDLRLLLAEQTKLPIGLVDLTRLDGPLEGCLAELKRQRQAGALGVLFDAMTEAHLQRIGQVLEYSAGRHAPLFSVGSSGIESALAAQWQSAEQAPSDTLPASDKPLLVIAGSCSPVTAEQIDHALGNGFVDAPLDAGALLAETGGAAVIATCLRSVHTALVAGRSVIVHSSRGADDPRRAETARALAKSGQRREKLTMLIGDALGQIAFACRQAKLIDRVCIAGGDTSSYAGQAMGLESFMMLQDFWPGAPICLASSADPIANGLQVVFKGGQVGGVDFFPRLANTNRTTNDSQTS